ncbi:MAG: ABC transporter permease, partial [Rhodospirillales bacterium]|nr:ABC transporter permease [Acetobacter sp.]
MLRELIFAARRLRQSSGFTAVALLTLALGIGTATTVFTLVQHVILQPLPYRESGRLVALWERVKFLQASFPVIGPNPRHVWMWQGDPAGNKAFASIAVFRHGATGLTIGKSEHPRLAGVLIGSANFLRTLGVHPVLGRDLGTSDTVPGQDGVALISYQLWAREWNKRPDVLGQTIRLSDRRLTIIAVLPFQHTAKTAHSFGNQERWV